MLCQLSALLLLLCLHRVGCSTSQARIERRLRGYVHDGLTPSERSWVISDEQALRIREAVRAAKRRRREDAAQQ